jgi:hypothetical protein
VSPAELRALWDESGRVVLQDPYAAEMAGHACLEGALALVYLRLGAERPGPLALPADLAERDPRAASLLRRYVRAPDARARFVFLGDLLDHVLAEG